MMKRNNRNTITDKFKKSGGFSLSEVLVTIIIASILFAGMATFLVTSLKVYNSTILASECQTLIDSVNTEVMHMLRYSEDVESDAEGNVIFSNKRTYSAGAGSEFYEYYIIDEHIEVDDEGCLVHTNGTDKTDVVNRKLYNNLKVADFKLTYTESTGVFDIEYSVKSGNQVLRTVPTFSIVRFGE